MSNLVYVIAALLIGGTLSLQPPINAIVARGVGSPLLASTISIATSFLFVVVVWLTLGRGTGELSQLKALPPWLLLGGVIGVIFVAGSVIVAPALGFALFFVCVVAGQLIAAVGVDHLGAFGLPVRPLNMMKLLGIALVLAGAALVQKSNSLPGVH